MKKILFLATAFFFLSLFLPTPSKAQLVSEEAPELIVKYKNGQAPDDVTKEVNRRTEAKKGFFGSLSVNVEDTTLKLQGQKTPEEKKTEIETIEKRIKVQRREEMFKDQRIQSNKNGELRNIETIDLPPGVSIQQAKKELQSLPEVSYVEENKKLSALTTIPNDTYYSQMWGLTKIQVEQAWDITKGSSQVIVAVLDSGIDYTHSDLPTTIIQGPSYPYPGETPIDRKGHGTHVAGTIGALTNNNTGVSGINWNVKLMAVKVLNDSGSGYTSDILQGITYAADNGAKVINMSLGGSIYPYTCPQDDLAMQETINYARSKGTTIIVAAGNSNDDAQYYTPAGCNGVISVGATGPQDERASYSNYGSVVDIAAPGGNPYPNGYFECNSFNTCASKSIISTFPLSASITCNQFSCAGFKDSTNLYGAIQGTSMASPHVAGVAALMLSVNPTLTPDQIETILKNSGDPITTDHPIGGKRLNALRAVQMSGSTPTSPITPTAVPSLTPTPIPTPTPTPPILPSPNGRIAFNRYVQSIDHVFTINPDGTGQRQITSNPQYPYNYYPTLSNDGNFVAYVSTDGGTSAIITISDRFGNILHTINAPSNASTIRPRFGPNGTTIYFTSSSYGGGSKIYKVNVDGTNMQIILDEPSNSTLTLLDVSSDGLKMLLKKYPTGGSYYDLFVANIDGTNQQNITNTPNQPEWEAAFSPDGQTVVFDTSTSLYKLALSTLATTLLFTPANFNPYDPSFSPNGTNILYGGLGSITNYKFVLYTIKTDGTENTAITPSGSDSGLGVHDWAPDPDAPIPTNTPFPTATLTPTITPTPTPMPGDINKDGQINIQDYEQWRCEFLGNGVCTNPPSNKSADINGDGQVDLIDFSIWRNAFANASS